MQIDESDAWDRVIASRGGVLGTLHADRGVDLVPVVYAVADDHTIFIPVDAVKPKTTYALQRVANLQFDPRCTLLVDEYDDDWGRLWWVRVSGEGRVAILSDLQRFIPLLAERYGQYVDPVAIEGGIVMNPVVISGWSAR